MSSTNAETLTGYTWTELFPIWVKAAVARMTGAESHVDAAFHVTGSPGTAKTAFNRAVYEEAHRQAAAILKVSPGNIPFISLMCPSLDPMDPRGLPVSLTEKGRTYTIWARPGESIMPALDRPAAYLFLDEPDKAAPAVRNALYQGLFERRFGEHALPATTFTACASNLVTDRAGGTTMESHGQNRMVHFQMSIDIDATNAYFASRGYDPAIMGFLKDFPDFAYRFNPRAKAPAYPTLRSWEFMAQQLALYGVDTMHVWGPGTVGDEACAKFRAYYDLVATLPRWERMRQLDPEEATRHIKALPPSIQYAAISMFSANVASPEDVDWMMDACAGVAPDYAGMAYTWLTQTYKAKAPLAWKSTKARRFHVDVGVALHSK